MNNAEFDLTDGMDISVFTYNAKKKQAQFSAAGQDLLYFKNKQAISIDGDIFPIGGSVNGHEYTKHIIEIEEDSPFCFYMFSDGFADQLGGEKIKRFGTQALKKLIAENIAKPMQEQKQIFDKTLSWWTKSYKQIDDITLTGFSLHA